MNEPSSTVAKGFWMSTTGRCVCGADAGVNHWCTGLPERVGYMRRRSDDPKWKFAHLCANCGEKIVERGMAGGRWDWWHIDSGKRECFPPLVATPAPSPGAGSGANPNAQQRDLGAEAT